MRVAFDDIPDDGLEVHADAADAWVRSALADAVAPPRAARLDVRIVRIGPRLRVKGSASVHLPHDCDRCGAHLEVALGGPVDLYYVPEDRTVAHDHVGLHRDELDIGYYDGVAIDLGDVFAEQVLLWVPDAVRCDDDAAVRLEDDGSPCALPEQDPGPDLARHNPFAKLRGTE